MDETPIKAGRTGPGKLRSAYFWPLYRERDEVSSLYFATRAAKNVEDALGLSPPDKAVLLSDGYSAYSHYARKTGITHAQCWTHTRRLFFEAQKIEPERAAHALDLIGKIYQVEAKIGELDLRGRPSAPIGSRTPGPWSRSSLLGLVSSSTIRDFCPAVH